MPRHLGQHSGGMVICQGQLDSVVPLEPASHAGARGGGSGTRKIMPTWASSKPTCSALGMMAVLKDSLELICLIRFIRKQWSWRHLPADDPAVYSTLQKADTIGLFQVESRAQMACLPRLMPKRFYDIVVQVAIIRPGPIVGQMVNPFLLRRQGREDVSYPHPSLEPVLERTLGVPLFQEQLLRIAMIAANFTGGEAEDLRRAMGFKRSEARMKDIEAKLRAGMTRNGISREAQEQIILSITSFALYGFPESHAASFALLAYASAYLKCHYLAAFTAALLNNQPMGFYSPATITKDAQRHGLKMLPVDVTRSEWMCTLEAVVSAQLPVVSGISAAQRRQNAAHGASRGLAAENGEAPEGRKNIALRLGLRYVRGLREEAGQALVRERMLASFTSIQDLARRVPELRKDELTTLAEIGALNSVASTEHQVPGFLRPSHPIESRNDKSFTGYSVLGTRYSLHRRDALWQVERAVRGSGPLLEKLPEDNSPSPLQPMNHEERLVADFCGTGLTVGPHPMAYRREWLKAMGIRRAIELRDIPHGRRLRIGGCVIVRQRPGTAKGFVFLSLEDETGVANAIISPRPVSQKPLAIGLGKISWRSKEFCKIRIM